MRTCKLDGCDNSLEGMRSHAVWCSRDCKKQARHRRRRKNSPLYKAIHGAKSRAKKQGLPFDLDADMEVPEVCPVLGIPLEKSSGGHSDNSPSLDRLVPEKGYVRDNVRVISWRANSLKSDATLEEIQALAAWMEEQLKD